MEERQSFVFYRSFRDALSGVPDDERIRIYDAIIDYALDRKEPEGLDPVALAAFRLVRPRLDANERRRQNGLKNGAKGKEFGRLGGNPAFKKGRPNPYYQKGRKAGEEVCEETCEETCEDKGKITPSGEEDNPEDIPEDKGKITPSGEDDNPEDIPEDNGEETCEDISKITQSDSYEGPGDNPKDKCKISPSGERDIPEDNGKDPKDIPEDIPEDNGEISPSGECDIPEDNGDISAEDKAKAPERCGASQIGGRSGREGGETGGKGVDLDIADNPYGGRDSEKKPAKDPKTTPSDGREGPKDNPGDNPKDNPKDNGKITPGITPAYPADVDINIINENGNERDISLSGKNSENVNERETSLSGYRNADGSERETSLPVAAGSIAAEAVFQSAPEAAVSKPEDGKKRMDEFIERFHIVRDYTGSKLREVDWEKVSEEYDASEYLATMPRYKSLKWIAFNHLTIEGGCYRPKNAGKRADCVERQKPVEGNPFGDWLSQGGDGDKN